MILSDIKLEQRIKKYRCNINLRKRLYYISPLTKPYTYYFRILPHMSEEQTIYLRNLPITGV